MGNPGARYTGTPHNVGYQVTAELAERWGLGKPRDKFNAKLAEGRIRPGGPRVTMLQPLTYMNESGKAVGPARGSLKVPPERVVVVHDEIDLPFGEVRSRLGGGMAGHRGLKSIKQHLGTPEFQRVRVGVGRPDSTDPEQVSAYVLGRFRQSPDEVAALVRAAGDETERVIEAAA
ncbi:MAG TPA: aminoacyl-tRNA hydrolase [Solirubrobacterales bacterium]|nr:aminoacyl-tRNA hydrolase [Solirubrobacterales bacterium]